MYWVYFSPGVMLHALVYIALFHGDPVEVRRRGSAETLREPVEKPLRWGPFYKLRLGANEGTQMPSVEELIKVQTLVPQVCAGASDSSFLISFWTTLQAARPQGLEEEMPSPQVTTALALVGKGCSCRRWSELSKDPQTENTQPPTFSQSNPLKRYFFFNKPSD